MSSPTATFTEPAAIEIAIDTGWTMQTAFLVLFMQCGFMMLEVGMVRAKNVKNIILKNVVDTSFACLGFFTIGYAFAFGSSSSSGFIGSGNYLLIDLQRFDHWLFQFAFCTTAVTIPCGSMAERTQFASYILYSLLVSVWIYPLVAHWVWSPVGWLRNLGSNGVLDFAGDSVVHLLGGCIGLMAAWAGGPRLGKFQAEGKPADIQGHSSPFAALGTIVLWFGWYGFNCGSTQGLSGYKAMTSSRVGVCTTLSACSAACTCLIWMRWRMRKYDVNMLLNALLAGLVAITGPCAFVQPWAAVIIGAVGTVVFVGSSKLLLLLRIDDPLDAAPVHMGCGMWGLLAGGLFADQSLIEQVYGETIHYGLFMGGGFQQLWVQLVALISVAAWSLTHAAILFFLLKHFYLLRVEQDTELAGLDNTKHAGPAYPYFQLIDA